MSHDPAPSCLNRVRVPRELASVSSRDAASEVDPRDAGMTREDVAEIWAAVERLYRSGTQPAITLCVRRDGHVVLNRAIGHARGNGPTDPKGATLVPATPETPFCVYSISKAVTAMVIHLLDGQGHLRLDDPVAEFIPEFGTRGKERTTIRHVLTHRAGIPSVAGHGNDPALLADWDRIVRLLCDAKPTSVPGRRLAYHAITGGYVLGEIVRRVTGRDIRQVLAESIQRPLGFRWLNYGVRPGEVDAVAKSYFTGSRVPPGVSFLIKRALGVTFEDAVTLSNDPRFLTSIVPSGNVVATAHELASFFEMLRCGGELGGVRVIDRRTVRRALTESSYLELDLTLGLPLRYGLGLMLGGSPVSVFGPSTPRAFGHYGFINVIGWADPDRNLSAALLTSGKPFLGPHLVRLWGVLSAIAHRCPRVA